MNIRRVTLFIEDDLSSANSTLEIKWRVADGIRTAEIDVSLDADLLNVILAAQHTSSSGGVAFPSELTTWEKLDRQRKA